MDPDDKVFGGPDDVKVGGPGIPSPAPPNRRQPRKPWWYPGIVWVEIIAVFAVMGYALVALRTHYQPKASQSVSSASQAKPIAPAPPAAIPTAATAADHELENRVKELEARLEEQQKQLELFQKAQQSQPTAAPAAPVPKKQGGRFRATLTVDPLKLPVDLLNQLLTYDPQWGSTTDN